jgi:hypothetical protein
MKSALGLAYGDPQFTTITEPYWTRGKGTTCAVTVEWALQQCGWEGPLNRGPNWVVGKHLTNAIQWARAHDKVINAPSLATLVPGDIIYLEGENPNDWHVGVLEKNEYPRRLITLDGGQTDKRGEQAISRVERPINASGLVGPKFRRVKLAIRP